MDGEHGRHVRILRHRSPEIGKDICECNGFGGNGRNINTPDIQWPAFLPGDYENGRCMSGAFWDMRTALADNDVSGKILANSLRQIQRGVEPNVAKIALLIDDNPAIISGGDNNLANGSPHYEKINEAFRGHGLAADNVAYAAVGWSGSPPGDPAHGQNMAVTVTAPLTAVQVLLRYRINGGSWNSIEMEEVDPGTESPSVPFQGIIPGANTTVGDVIDLYVRVEMSDTNKPFTCFPTQAQLRFPDPGYGPDDRNFFTRVVTDSAKQTALSTDFATDPGWTSDPTGKWVFGEPTFTDHGEQPGFDFPFDANTNCCFTHETESVTGTWRLDTNTFSLAGADAAVVRFALWFFVRNGTAQNDKFIVRIGDGSTFTTILTVSAQDLDESAPGAEQRIRWIRKSVTITDPNQLMSGRVLRFSAIRNSSNGTIEAAIDEVRVWRAYD